MGSLREDDTAEAIIAAINESGVDDTCTLILAEVLDSGIAPQTTQPAPRGVAPFAPLLLIVGIAVWSRR